MMRNCPIRLAQKLAIGVGLLLCPAFLLAQKASGVPDLSGNWSIAPGGPSWDPNDVTGNKPDELPMTPWARERLKAAKPPFGVKGTFDNPTDPVQKYCDSPGATRL